MSTVYNTVHVRSMHCCTKKEDGVVIKISRLEVFKKFKHQKGRMTTPKSQSCCNDRIGEIYAMKRAMASLNSVAVADKRILRSINVEITRCEFLLKLPDSRFRRPDYGLGAACSKTLLQSPISGFAWCCRRC
jgi:hypothetical protein